MTAKHCDSAQLAIMSGQSRTLNHCVGKRSVKQCVYFSPVIVHYALATSALVPKRAPPGWGWSFQLLKASVE